CAVGAEYSSFVKSFRALNSAFMEFAQQTFDDFRILSEAEKHCVSSISILQFKALDDAYRSTSHFPNDNTIMPSYLSQITAEEEDIERFVDDCPHSFNRKDIIKKVQLSLKRKIEMTKLQFIRVKPSEEEFLVLLGLSFWSNRIADHRENLVEIVERNRREILAELHHVYIRNGSYNYASRLGELLCLLVSLERCAMLEIEDLTVYKLMNFYNE
ncbi:hypothetical protein PFISCL1PPCAC_14714, partial [Pristionchus fissidentatus]